MKNYVKTISLCLGLASLTFAQTTTAPIYNASIYGGQLNPGLGDGLPGNSAIITNPQGIAVDASGNVYISDNTNGRIRRIDGGTGVISTFASVSGPNGLAIDNKNNLFVASGGSHIVNRYSLGFDTKGGTVQATATLIAGESGNNRCCEDGQRATDALLNAPGGVAVDNNGNVYIADTSNNRIREVTNANNCIYNAPTNCIITTIAGPGGTAAAGAGNATFGANGQSNVGSNSVGDGGLAVLARVNGPFGIAVTPDGSTVYFSSTADHRIRKIDMVTGLISSVLGACVNSSTTSSGVTLTTPPISAITSRPIVIPCPAGTVSSATSNSTNSQLSTLYDGQVGTAATANNPRGLFLDSVHNKLYFADSSNNRIRVIDLTTGIVMTVVGSGNTGGANSSDGVPLTSLNINTPYGVWVTSSGQLYFTEQPVNRVRVVDFAQGTTSTLTGLPRSTGTGGPATAAILGVPTAGNPSSGASRVGVDPAGNVYVVETTVNKIRKITPDGIISDWAGSGQTTALPKNPTTGIPIDGGIASASRLNNPGCVAFDSNGNAFIADTGNNLIRMVDTNGIISTVVGRFKVTANSNPSLGCAPGPQSKGQCTVDPSGNYFGDGGLATQAFLNAPQCVAVDGAGNLYIADTGNNAIRKVTASTGVIDTIAGGISAHIPGGPTPADGRSGLGSSGASGDGGNALLGTFNTPRGVAVDPSGNVYVADFSNPALRELIPNGRGGYTLTSVFGAISSSNNDGIGIPTGTGAPSNPIRTRVGSGGFDSVATDVNGNIYITDSANSKILIEDAAHTKVYEIAGGGSADTGLTYTSGNGFNLSVPNPTGVAVDNNFNVYSVDRTGVVRKLTPPKAGFPTTSK